MDPTRTPFGDGSQPLADEQVERLEAELVDMLDRVGKIDDQVQRVIGKIAEVLADPDAVDDLREMLAEEAESWGAIR